MRSAVATRRQFLAAGGVALAGAVLSRSIAAQALKFPSPSRGGQGGGSTPLASPSPSGGGRGGGSTASATATPTPAPTPATVTIPMPVFPQNMGLDCETAALHHGLAYYRINVSQSQLFAAAFADTRRS